MNERNQSNESGNEMRLLGIALTVLVWGTIGVILLLNVTKDVVAGIPIEPKLIVVLVAAIVTVVGTLLGDTPRRIVGAIWLITAALGFICFVIGAGFELEALVEISLQLMIGGVISVSLIFIPEQSRNS